MTENKKLKFIQKPNKQKMVALLLVFLWMLVWNVIYEALHMSGKLEFGSIHIINWPFFMSVIVFFLREHLSYKERFCHTLFGGAFGIVFAAGVIFTYSKLAGAGITKLAAICIPLAIVLFILIVLEPIFPIFFNNIGLAYFVVALVNNTTAVHNMPSYLVSLVLGSIILNLGSIAILKVYTGTIAKKAKAKAAAEKTPEKV